ncbi:MAG: hypothetical protein PHU57_05260 [Patescibacteria group bacterium]|nr:hypothetical protein [Patescibacteria group bacterium]
MIEHFGAENIYIISAVPQVQGAFKLGNWFRGKNLQRRIGLLSENIIICQKGREKGKIAAGLNLTHMIDDRPEVLNRFSSRIHPIAFKPDPEKMEEYPKVAARATVVKSWAEIEKHFDL